VAGRVYSASEAAMVRDLVYLSLLGNDPAPAYLGLKMVERRTRGVARAIFYALRAWNEVYKAKRCALFALLEEKGIPFEVRPLSEAAIEEEDAEKA